MSGATRPPEGRRWLEPRECHGNDGFCTRCSPRNPTRSTIMLNVDQAARDLADAIRLTVEYVGNDTLPAVEGWSWYDALRRYAPSLAAQFRDHPVLLHGPPLGDLPDLAAGVYQHYKGGRYLVLGYGRDTHYEGRTGVVYVPLYTGEETAGPRLQFRPVEEFLGHLHPDGEGGWYGCTHPEDCDVPTAQPRYRYEGTGT